MYDTPPVALAVPDANAVCFKIGFPSGSFITKFVLVQTAGAAGVYTAELFTAPVKPYDDAPYDIGDVHEELYRVMAKLTSAASKIIFFDTTGYPFRNSQVSVAAQTVPNDSIYLRITPPGAGARVYTATISGRFGEMT